MNNKEIEVPEYLDNGIKEKEKLDKFLKVLDPPNFVFWHFEIIYDKDNKKEVVKYGKG